MDDGNARRRTVRALQTRHTSCSALSVSAYSCLCRVPWRAPLRGALLPSVASVTAKLTGNIYTMTYARCAAAATTTIFPAFLLSLLAILLLFTTTTTTTCTGFTGSVHIWRGIFDVCGSIADKGNHQEGSDIQVNVTGSVDGLF